MHLVTNVAMNVGGATSDIVARPVRRHAPPPSVLRRQAESPEERRMRAVVIGIWCVAAALLVTLALLVRS